MFKYSKLTDEIIKKKLEKSISPDFSDEVNDNVKEVLSNFDRSKAEELCDSIEKLVATIKIQKKKEKEDQDKLDKEKNQQLKMNDIEDQPVEEKKKFEVLVSREEFVALKNSFGIFQLDDDGNYKYPSLYEQFKDTLLKTNVKLFEVEYKYPEIYSENRNFIHKNVNIGFFNRFIEMSDYLFVCLRFSVSPLSGKCVYTSLWIVNLSESLENLLKDDYNSFNFVEVPDENKLRFIDDFQKTTSETVIDERYIR